MEQLKIRFSSSKILCSCIVGHFMDFPIFQRFVGIVAFYRHSCKFLYGFHITHIDNNLYCTDQN